MALEPSEDQSLNTERNLRNDPRLLLKFGSVLSLNYPSQCTTILVFKFYAWFWKTIIYGFVLSWIKIAKQRRSTTLMNMRRGSTPTLVNAINVYTIGSRMKTEPWRIKYSNPYDNIVYKYFWIREVRSGHHSSTVPLSNKCMLEAVLSRGTIFVLCTSVQTFPTSQIWGWRKTILWSTYHCYISCVSNRILMIGEDSPTSYHLGMFIGKCFYLIVLDLKHFKENEVQILGFFLSLGLISDTLASFPHSNFALF